MVSHWFKGVRRKWDGYAGENKYEFSCRTKAIWDEAAKIAEKYGMKRGTPEGQHKPYLQWLREQICINEKNIEEQGETITQQSAEITEQRQLLYDINAEIKTAEKK